MSVSTIRYLLERSIERNPNKIAIIDNSESITFLDLYYKVNKITKYLEELNLKNETRIAIYSNKSISQVVSILAVLSTKYIVVPISNLLKPEQVDYILKDCNIQCVITDDTKISTLLDLDYDKHIISMNKNDTYMSFDEIYDSKENVNEKFSILSIKSAAIIYSSGSTGFPKGIVSSHRNLFDGSRIVSTYLELTEDDVISGVLSFNFDYGLNQIYCVLYNNSTLALHNYLFPNDFYKHLVKDKITILPLMPVFLSRIFDEKMTKNLDKSLCENIRLICSSGGKVTNSMIENITEYFHCAKFYSMYGLTEAFRSTYLPPEQIKTRPHSIGKAIPDVELYVINDDGEECKPREIGELIHRGGCIGKGYWNRSEDTALRYKTVDILNKVIDLDGCLTDEFVVCSGDYVYKDEEDYIYFVSRKDDMIKSSGYRISPYEIESSLYTHVKEIQECAVFSIDNEQIGQEIVMAYTSDVAIKDSTILLKLKKHLPNYMIPTIIYSIGEMPTTTANQGKINKSLIKNDFLKKNKLR